MIPLPLVLSPDDLRPIFKIGQKLVYRKQCEVTIVEVNNSPAEGYWYTIQFEDRSGNSGEMRENVVCKDLRLRRGDILAEPAAPKISESKFPDPPSEHFNASSPEVGVPNRKKRRPLTIQENSYSSQNQPIIQSDESSESSAQFSPVTLPPRKSIKNNNYVVGTDRPFIHKLKGDRLQCFLISKNLSDDGVLEYTVTYDDGEVRTNVPSYHIVTCQPLRPLTEMPEAPLVSEASTFSDSSQDEFISDTIEILPAGTGKEFVHRAEDGERHRCFIKSKTRAEDGTWSYLVDFDDGEEATVSGASLSRRIKSRGRRDYKDILKSGNLKRRVSTSSGGSEALEDSEIGRIGISRKSKSPGRYSPAKRRSLSPALPGFAELFETNLEIEKSWGRASLGVWLEVFVAQARALSFEARLVQSMKILPRIGDYFCTRRPGNFRIAAYGLESVTALARAVDLSSDDVSVAVRAACALSIDESLKERAALRPSQVRDVLWLPVSASIGSEPSWNLSAAVLLLCCKSMSRENLTAVSNFFISRIGNLATPEFLLQFFPSLGPSGLSLLSRGQELLNRASRELSEEFRNSRPSDGRRADLIAGCWRSLALALDDELFWFEARNDKRDELIKSGGFGVALNHHDIFAIGKYKGKTFAEVLAIKGYSSWLFENVKPPFSPSMKSFMEYASRSRMTVCIAGKSVMEQTSLINKDNYQGWLKKMMWACTISTSIFKNVSRDLPLKDSLITFLEVARIAFDNAYSGLPLTAGLNACDGDVRHYVLEDVIKPLQAIQTTVNT